MSVIVSLIATRRQTLKIRVCLRNHIQKENDGVKVFLKDAGL